MKRNFAAAIAYADMMAERCFTEAYRANRPAKREKLLAKARLWATQAQEMSFGK
jgi:hypothetical protein